MLGSFKNITMMLGLLASTSFAHPEIIIHGTRAIYPADAREITLQVSNNGDKPSLVQAWIDEGDPKRKPEQSKAPFIITPPISRVDPTKSQSLRITALPNAKSLSGEQETVFWLNVLDIPPKLKANAQSTEPDNFLQLAIRSRIKLFYRPTNLKDKVAEAPAKLQWKQVGNQLQVINPTAYHVTITSILSQQTNGKLVDLMKEGIMVSPKSSENINLKSAITHSKLSFTTINDFGGRIQTDLKLNP